jgi:hypothetical protein
MLLIIYNFKPQSSNQSKKYELLLPYLEKKYKEIDVLTSYHAGLKYTEKLSDITTVYRTNHKWLAKGAREKPAVINSKNITQKIKRLVKSIVYSFLWPDFARFWIRPALKLAIDLCQIKNYDTVVTVSFPFSCHIVGLKLKNMFPCLYLIVDYIDPFAILTNKDDSGNNSLLYRYFNFHYEKRVNFAANKILLSYQSSNNYPQKLLKVIRHKLLVVPPWQTLSCTDFENAKNNYFGGNKLSLLYIGSLYARIRNPEYALSILSRASNLNCNIYFVGHKEGCDKIISQYKSSVSPAFHFLDKVNGGTALEMLKSADILVYIDNSTSKQLPSKILEYLYVNKKIILFINDVSSPTYVFLKNHDFLSAMIFVVNKSVFSDQSLLKLEDFVRKDINSVRSPALENFNIEKFAEVYFCFPTNSNY